MDIGYGGEGLLRQAELTATSAHGMTETHLCIARLDRLEIVHGWPLQANVDKPLSSPTFTYMMTMSLQTMSINWAWDPATSGLKGGCMASMEHLRYEMTIWTGEHAQGCLWDHFLFKFGMLCRAGDAEVELVLDPGSLEPRWRVGALSRAKVEALHRDTVALVDRAWDLEVGFTPSCFDLVWSPLFGPRDVLGNNLVGAIYVEDGTLWQVVGLDLVERATMVRVQRLRREPATAWKAGLRPEGKPVSVPHAVVKNNLDAAGNAQSADGYRSIVYTGVRDTVDMGLLNTWDLHDPCTGRPCGHCLYAPDEPLVAPVRHPRLEARTQHDLPPVPRHPGHE